MPRYAAKHQRHHGTLDFPKHGVPLGEPKGEYATELRAEAGMRAPSTCSERGGSAACTAGAHNRLQIGL
jgi:hypothetical protein